MKIKISSLMKSMIILMILMQFSFFKLLGGQFSIFSTSYDQYPLVVAYLLIVVFVCLMLILQPPARNRYLIVLFLFAAAATMVGIFNGMESNGIIFMAGLSQGYIYLYILLAFPIYNLLVNDCWDLRSLLKLLVILGLAAYAMRAFISVYYGVTGNVIYPNIAEEFAISNWVRNGRLRINPPFIGILMLPIAYYLAKTTENRIHKYFYYGSIVVPILYSMLVHQARSVLIYHFVTLVLMFLFEKVDDRKKLIRGGVIAIMFVIAINTKWVSDLIDSFSLSNAETGSSTKARLDAIAYYGVRYLQKPAFGLGFLRGDQTNISTLYNFVGSITDIGILRSIFMLGLPILIVFILLFVRGFYVYRKVKKAGMAKEALLIFGMTVLVIMTGINIDLFISIFGFAIPFYVAIVEYLNWKAAGVLKTDSGIY